MKFENGELALCTWPVGENDVCDIIVRVHSSRTTSGYSTVESEMIDGWGMASDGDSSGLGHFWNVATKHLQKLPKCRTIEKEYL
jgi:hypothetical protein